ncbi:hypothetical protein CEXT_452561, partial [Caerostris extrusa]
KNQRLPIKSLRKQSLVYEFVYVQHKCPSQFKQNQPLNPQEQLDILYQQQQRKTRTYTVTRNSNNTISDNYHKPDTKDC